MNANKTLLRMLYTRVIVLFAEKAKIPLEDALEFFYHSEEFKLVRKGVSDLHCMSDDYLAEDLLYEYNHGVSRYGG